MPAAQRNDTEGPSPASVPQPAGETAAAPLASIQPDRHLFGLRQDNTNHAPIFADDYAKRLPEDVYGDETQPNARVWRAYEEEAAAFDSIMIGQSRDGLDVMLVFAGLFSAVVTSFLVQVSQNLEANYSEMTALLLHDLVVMQIAAPDGSSSANITSPSADPTASFTPDALDVWVNGLWAVSLAASLIVALSAVLVKQWLHHYMSLPSGTPGLRSHVRHLRLMGFERWHVAVIIGLLPIIMHASLALFLLGLMLFYIPLRLSLTCAIATISSLVLVLYITSNILPIVQPDCPYHTPLTAFCFYFQQSFTLVLARTQERTQKLLQRIGRPFRDAPAAPQTWAPTPKTVSPKPLRDLETSQVNRDYDKLSVHALDWLFAVSSNPSLQTVALEAIAGLPLGLEEYARRSWTNAKSMADVRDTLLHDCMVASVDASGSKALVTKSPMLWLTERESTVERLLRSVIFFDATSTHIRRPDTRVSNNPMLVASATLYNLVLTPDDVLWVRDLCWDHPDTQLHPPVWRMLIARALKSPQSTYTVDPSHIIAGLLFNANPRVSSTASGAKRAQQRMSLDLFLEEFPAWDMIQQMPMFLTFDTEPGTLQGQLRVQIILWEFALRTLADTGMWLIEDLALLQGVLGCVIGCLTSGPEKPVTPALFNVWRAAVCRLLVKILRPMVHVCTDSELIKLFKFEKEREKEEKGRDLHTYL